MYTDFHSHILPNMDDGAKNLEMALEMINLEYQQNVDTLILTPHFYNYKEDIDSFLKRREISFNALEGGKFNLPPIKFRLGAEVYLTKRISQTFGLDRLCIGGTKYLLIEMPYEPIMSWMMDEIDNIIYNYSITPMFAHVDRYLHIYKKSDYAMLSSVEGAVFQVNNDSVLTRKPLKFVKKLLKNEISIVFGSDAHNLSSRAPNFNEINEIIVEKNFKGILSLENFKNKG